MAAVLWWRLRQPCCQTLARLRPAVGVAGDEQLEGLGEAALAGAVAAHDEREAGAGGQVEGLPLADAAEALDGDGLEVGAQGLAAGLRFCWRLLWLAWFRVVVQVAGEGLGAVEGGEDEHVALGVGFGLGR